MASNNRTRSKAVKTVAAATGPAGKVAASAVTAKGRQEPQPVDADSPNGKTAPKKPTTKKPTVTKSTTRQRTQRTITSTHRRAVKAAKSAPTGPTSRYKSILKAEWVMGMLIIWIYPIFNDKFTANFGDWVKRQTFWTVAFIMMMLVAPLNAKVAKFEAAFGGLALLALLITTPATVSKITTLAKTTPKENAVPRNVGTPWPQTFLNFLNSPGISRNPNLLMPGQPPA